MKPSGRAQTPQGWGSRQSFRLFRDVFMLNSGLGGCMSGILQMALTALPGSAFPCSICAPIIHLPIYYLPTHPSSICPFINPLSHPSNR